MKAIEIEGTIADIQKQINRLPQDSNARLRVRIEDAEPEREPIDYVPTEFRNGVPLLPKRGLKEPITLELIQRILEEEDEDIIRQIRAARR